LIEPDQGSNTQSTALEVNMPTFTEVSMLTFTEVSMPTFTEVSMLTFTEVSIKEKEQRLVGWKSG
jgi:hypothetical protein